MKGSCLARQRRQKQGEMHTRIVNPLTPIIIGPVITVVGDAIKPWSVFSRNEPTEKRKKERLNKLIEQVIYKFGRTSTGMSERSVDRAWKQPLERLCRNRQQSSEHPLLEG